MSYFVEVSSESTSAARTVKLLNSALYLVKKSQKVDVLCNKKENNKQIPIHHLFSHQGRRDGCCLGFIFYGSSVKKVSLDSL